jgi:YHS domain-containing protein
MNMMIALMTLAFASFQEKDPASTKEAMKRVQFLVGDWKATWSPEGKDAKDSWEEIQSWEYKIDKEEYGLQYTIKDGKKHKSGLLTYDLKKKVYHLELTGLDDKKSVFEGKLSGKELTLDPVGDEKGAQEKINYNFLRDNRFIGDMQKREAGAKAWVATATIQYTKQGVPFVRSEAPKCIVTGGTGSIEVSYGGKTYYICCNSCKKEFLAEPAKTLETAKKEGWIK